MLIRFIVSNFMSFKEETEFNMLTGNFKIHKHHVHKEKGVDLLKMAAIYGANGAGKSNLCRALYALYNQVINGEKEDILTTSWNTFKLDPKQEVAPTCFEIEFIQKNRHFIYYLEYQDGYIQEELLIEIKKNKEYPIFKRTLINEHIKIEFSEYSFSIDTIDLHLIGYLETKILNKNQPLITEITKKDYEGFESLKQAYSWFNRLLFISPNTTFKSIIEPLNFDLDFHEFANKTLKLADTGVESLGLYGYPFEVFFGKKDFKIKEQILKDLENKEYTTLDIDDGYHVLIQKDDKGTLLVYNIETIHKGSTGQEIRFDLEEESDGTRRVLDILLGFFFVFKVGYIVIIDEIMRSMHPSLTKELITLYANHKDTQGQLIFTTHESNLLDLKIFRQDEIWFAEKNEYGESKFYSLSDFKPRYDKDIRKDYLNGRYGGIPFLRDMENLTWEEYAEETK